MDEIPRPAAHVFVNDPEALAGAIQGSVLRPVRLSGTPGTSELARLMMPASCLDFVRLGNPMLFSGAMTSQGYTLVFVLDCPRSARAFNFSTDYTGGYLGFFPPGGLLDSTTSAGYANVTLTVPTEVFLEAVSHHCPGINDTLLTRGAGLRIPPADQAPLRLLVTEVHRLIAARSDLLTDPLALRLLEQEIIETFLRAFRGGLGDLLPPPTPRVARREHRLRKAREVMEACLDAPLSIPDIAAAVGLSPRGLEFLFRDFLGLSPAAYLRNLRLHAARRMLLHSERRSSLIKEVAYAHGFWHLGRFASTYREFFGELPSETCGTRIGPADQ